jgi:hypothetical protein
MEDRKSLGPFDPTEEEIAEARSKLRSDLKADDLRAVVLGWVSGNLDAINNGADPEKQVRRARAWLAVYGEREAAGS